MRGAIAAGHRLTAEAGAEILAEGGNAVDACLAAAFVSWVAESPLTGPAAGGFLLVHRARDRSDRLLDFFVSVPGQGSKRPPKPHMESIDIDFDATSQVVYLIGPARAPCPAPSPGSRPRTSDTRSLPWRRLLEPAIDLAREGVELTPAAGVPARDPRPDPPTRSRGPRDLRRVRTAHGRASASSCDDLASTLERARRGRRPGALPWRARPRARSLSRRERGPRSRAPTSADYRVIWRRPIRVPYEGHEFVSNPPPSSGGDPDRLRALAARPAFGGRRKAGQRVGDRAARRRDARAARGRGRGASSGDLYRGGLAAQTPRGREPPGGAGPNRAARGKRPRGRGCARDHAHLGRRRAGKRGLADGFDRVWLGRDRAGHRHPHEQHARRVRPQPVRAGERDPGRG